MIRSTIRTATRMPGTPRRRTLRTLTAGGMAAGALMFLAAATPVSDRTAGGEEFVAAYVRVDVSEEFPFLVLLP